MVFNGKFRVKSYNIKLKLNKIEIIRLKDKLTDESKFLE